MRGLRCRSLLFVVTVLRLYLSVLVNTLAFDFLTLNYLVFRFMCLLLALYLAPDVRLYDIQV